MKLKSLARSVRELARDLRPPITSTIEWPGLTITGLHPVKPLRGHVINKFNHVVLRGEVAGKPVKLYEAATEEHARFLEAIAGEPRLASWFPPIVARHRRCLLAHWVDGEAPAEDAAISEIIELQTRMHAIAASELPVAGWEFWSDYLRPRFLRAADMVGTIVDDLVAIVDEDQARPRVVVHLDLKPANLIVDASKATRSIDNESCSVSTQPLIDVCHTARAVKGRAGDYWKRYRSRANPDVSPKVIDALQILWLSRLVGSLFVAGQLADAAQLIRDHRAGRRLLPFDPHAT